MARATGVHCLAADQSPNLDIAPAKRKVFVCSRERITGINRAKSRRRKHQRVLTLTGMGEHRGPLYILIYVWTGKSTCNAAAS